MNSKTDSERDVLPPLLLRVVGRLGPDPALQIKVDPLGLQHLSKPRPCEQLKPDRIARALVRVLVEHPAEPP